MCAFLCATALLVRSSDGQAHTETLPGILNHLDESAKTFHGLSANVERTNVTIVVNDHSTEDGTLLVRGDKMLLQMTTPDPKTVLKTGDNLYVYTPGLKRVEEFNLGKNRELAEEFLLLGFGTSGKGLQKGFDIKYAGEDKVGDKTDAKLELTPRSAAVKNQFSKIEIWLDENTWLADQQKFTENGSGDYFTVRYTKIVRNPDISESQFKQHWPKGTEHVKPQG